MNDKEIKLLDNMKHLTVDQAFLLIIIRCALRFKE